MLVEEEMPSCSHPFLKIGQRVRIRSGALSGIEGILVSRGGERTLVISLNAIQRSLSVSIRVMSRARLVHSCKSHVSKPSVSLR